MILEGSSFDCLYVKMVYDFDRLDGALATHIVDGCVALIEQDLPKFVYKYTRFKYAQSLVREGGLRLGSIFEYRYLENVASGQHDPHEGTATVQGQLPNFLKFVSPVITRPKWIYCTSDFYQESLLESFDVKNDAIVEIEAIPFFIHLSKAMSERSCLSELRKVQYLSANRLHFDDIRMGSNGLPRLPSVAHMKDVVFGNEREIRMSFEVNGKLYPEPFNVTRPAPKDMGPVGGQFGVPPSLDSRVPVNAIEAISGIRVPELTRYCRIAYRKPSKSKAKRRH